MEAGVPKWPCAKHDSCNRSWIEYTLSIRKWVQLASELRSADYGGTGNMSRKATLREGAVLFGDFLGSLFLVYTVSVERASFLVICAAISRCRHVVHLLKMRPTQLGFQCLRGN